MKIGFCKALNWLDIAIIVLALVIISALTLPNYKKFQCRAKQSEAKSVLMDIYHTQKYYFSQKGEYATLQELLSSKRLKIKSKYYVVTDISKNLNKGFRAEAKYTNNDIAKDTWIVDTSAGKA